MPKCVDLAGSEGGGAGKRGSGSARAALQTAGRSPSGMLDTDSASCPLSGGPASDRARPVAGARVSRRRWRCPRVSKTAVVGNGPVTRWWTWVNGPLLTPQARPLEVSATGLLHYLPVSPLRHYRSLLAFVAVLTAPNPVFESKGTYQRSITTTRPRERAGGLRARFAYANFLGVWRERIAVRFSLSCPSRYNDGTC
ncbi:hypothetical protein MIND_00177900 [Mycena indigotica]|uniref:Uncharacterized protein n=1 Tax=Mycena indigotica TaxID=2126181 RepID=A0A8H6TFU8_9AGAR|nr:uncharacterized protein MIND_00177900 [Mycena indigotica]KAF7316581.1 hypothetical protein MIND_00177900 [Mycena indigotica]